MYAVIVDGARQVRVQEGQELQVDYQEALHEGDQLVFDQVLALSTDQGLQVGKPTLADARVTAVVLGVESGKKIFVQKLRRRKNSRRRTGHRQLYTRVRIEKIA